MRTSDAQIEAYAQIEEARAYQECFKREYLLAKEELMRLQTLFRDVCWYSFETFGKWWGKRSRCVYLHGHRYGTFHRHGSLREMAEFPIYYNGPADDAPRLPPIIVLREVEAAREYMDECRARISAPWDWAPGGFRYEELRKTTQVGRRFSSES